MDTTALASAVTKKRQMDKSRNRDSITSATFALNKDF